MILASLIVTTLIIAGLIGLVGSSRMHEEVELLAFLLYCLGPWSAALGGALGLFGCVLAGLEDGWAPPAVTIMGAVVFPAALWSFFHQGQK